MDRSRLEGAFGAVVAALGAWGLFAAAFVLAGLDFAALRAFAWIPFVAAAVFSWWSRLWGDSVAVESDAGPARGVHSDAWRFGVPVAIAAAYAWTASPWVFWVPAVCYLTIETRAVRIPLPAAAAARPPRESAARQGRSGLALLAIVGAAAVLLTAGARRPDPDDAYFVNAAVSAIEAPDAALFGFDGMHRDGLPPVEQALHQAQVYELLVAVVASLSGLPVGLLYYVLLPPLWAILALVANWVVLRALLPRSAALVGLVALVFLLVVWGDGHRAFGNFGFVRLFQGKAVFLVAGLPAIVLAALRFRENPRWQTWGLLLLAEAAAVGLTTNALLVAPIAAGLALVARPEPTREFARTALLGGAASLPLVLLAVAMYVRIAPYRGALDVDLVLLGYETVLGTTRAALALLGLLVLPALAASAGLARARWLTGYVWAIAVVVLFPASGAIAAGTFGNTFSWRIFWAAPLPLLLALAAGTAVSPYAPRRALRAGALGLWVAAFALAGPWAIRSGIWSWANLGRAKVAAAPYAAAEVVARVTSPSARALVPEAVAVALVGLPGAPPLVAVRRLYLAKLEGVIPPDDLATRRSLFAYVDGRPDAPPLARAIKLLERERIATVVFPDRHRDAVRLEAVLGALGFAIQHVAGFVVAARPG